MIGHLESWITLAKNDVDAWTALVLAKSLRRTLTTRKLMIIISESVTPEIQHVLTAEFDFVKKVDSSELQLWNCSEALLKIWVWSLKAWNKCVFIDSNTIVLRNCDELFEEEELTAVQNGIGFDPSLFVFKPSANTFQELLKIVQDKKEVHVKENDIFRIHFGNWSNSKNQHLSGETYSVTELNRKCSSAKLVKFNNYPWKLLNGHEHSFEKTWFQIYHEEVLQIVKQEKKTGLQTALLKSLSSIGLPLDSPSERVNQFLPSAELLNSIAVIGMSCRFPGSNSTSEYWDFLCSGADGITHFPADRPKSLVHTSEEYYATVKAGFLKCPIDEFDSKFFGISPREAELMDPQQRILLEVTWESLESSGINPHSLKDSKTGVFMGIWQQEYDRMFVPVLYPMHYKQLGNSYGASASRISFLLGLLGPNIAMESGCSSSLAALHLACESLRRGESSMAIAGGANIFQIMPTPEFNATLAPDFHCKTFDESANGFGRGEGCGVLVLKRFADAWNDGDNILAAIRGSATNNDGASTSFGTPFAPGQASAARDALRNSGVSPLEISYVEAHGTGTPVGDPIEFSALTQVYKGQRPQPLFISSVKTNIGHAEAAAGIAGVIKVIMSMQNGRVPPHLNLKRINPKIDLAAIPARIATEVTEWKTTPAPKIAAISAFSLSGNNAHMIIQEAPVGCSPQNTQGNLYDTQILTMSAKSEESLDALRAKYVEFLKSKIEPSVQLQLQDVVYTANCGRAHFPHRLTICAKTLPELATKLERGNFTSSFVSPAENARPKIGFLFTGQGSQYVGMANGLYNSNAIFRDAFNKCDAIFKVRLGVSVDKTWKSTELLEKALYSAPSIFCLQYCLMSVWASLGVKPDYVLGHSVGEFAAAVCAGVLSLEDAMHLIIERSLLIDQLSGGAMLALKANISMTNLLIEKFKCISNGWVDIGAINSQEEVVVSGKLATLSAFQKLCEAAEVKTHMLSASHAFHSRDMEAILDKFGFVASQIRHKPIKCVYVSALKAKILSSSEFNAEYWQQHVRQPVNFSNAFKLVSENCGILVEIGPHPVLLALAMSNSSGGAGLTCCPSLRRTEEDSFSMSGTLSKLYLTGVPIEWKSWHGKGRKVGSLPFYAFQRQKFWYVEEEGDAEKWRGGGPSGQSLGGAKFGRNARIVHPILGCQMPSPQSMTTTFFNSLRINSLSFLADHKIDGHVIFPAAGYLESVMAAGINLLIGQSSRSVPLSIEHFSIQAPLELSSENSKTACEIQTIVTKSQDGEKDQLKVAIFNQCGSVSDKWRQHAVGIFKIFSRQESASHSNINLAQVKTKLIKYPVDKQIGLYQRLSQIGYDFGPKFQSIDEIWSSEFEVLAGIELSAAETNEDGFICHPIILDSLLQTVAVQSILAADAKSTESSLLLPVGCRRFIWLGKNLSKRVFCHYGGDANTNVSLYNDNGDLVAFMEDVEFLTTTMDSFVKTLHADALQIPTFHDLTWRPSLGNTSGRSDVTQFAHATQTTPYTAKAVKEVGDMEKSLETIIEEIAFLYISKSVQECDWPWVVGKPINHLLEWTPKLPEKMRDFKLPAAYLEIFKKEGVVDSASRPIKNLPTISECDKKIKQLTGEFTEKFPQEDATIRFVNKCGSSLTTVLEGTVTGLSVLFPQSQNEFSVEEFYARSKFMQPNLKIISHVLLDTVAPLATVINKKSGNVLRILEVGAGTGSATSEIQKSLTELGIPFHFTFTDISSHFLEEGKKKFSSAGKTNFDYKVLNLEEDPLSQGFAPNSFDIVVSCNVVHATKDLAQSLQNIRMLLREGGIFILGELFIPYAYLTLSFGMVNGWWRFDDTNGIRTTSPLVDTSTWEMVLMRSRFKDIRSVQIMNGGTGCLIATAAPSKIQFSHVPKKTWVLFGDGSKVGRSLSEKLRRYNRRAVLVNISKTKSSMTRVSPDEFIVNPSKPIHFTELFGELKDSDLEGVLFLSSKLESPSAEEFQTHFCTSLLNICQAVITFYDHLGTTAKPRLVVITQGVHYLEGDCVSSNPHGASLWGVMKVFANENPDYKTRLVDLYQTEDDNAFFNPNEGENDELFYHLWENFTDEHFLAIRDGKLFLQRLKETPNPSSPLDFPRSDRFEFLNNCDGVLKDLQIVPASKPTLKPDELEVAVAATSLNFRDLLVILKPDGFSLPGAQIPTVGLDFSGHVVSKGSQVTKFEIGDAVYGYTDGGALCSHAVVPEIYLTKKPPQMTFASAASIPGVFMTSYVSLVNISTLTFADRVLIHVAAGGVGLAAIQIAKHIGATIFATAGSARKRNYLRSLGIKYIYNSRNTDYGMQIQRDTNGAGVTVVLNSLTSENFKETTLNVCANGARWVEIAKINIWKDAEVKALRPDLKYVVFDLATMARESPAEVGPLLNILSKLFADGIYADIPRTVFAFDQLREALTFFQEAKHIGKIVIKMPTPSMSLEGRFQLRNRLFDAESSYLITGGLGGLGIEVTKWMQDNGARHIFLVGRTAPNPNSHAAKSITEFNNLFPGSVIVINADVGCYSECARVLQEIQKYAPLQPLRGIMHAAGCLSDGIITSQTWEKFTTVFNPKVYGAWHFHNLTQHYDLEHFVMFSSMSTTLGTRGQSNHSAANAYLDSLAHYRISVGLPATTINWGAWSDVGAAAGLIDKYMHELMPFSPSQGIAALEKIIVNKYRQTIVGEVVSWNQIKQLYNLGEFTSDLRQGQVTSAKSDNAPQLNLAVEIKNCTREEVGMKIGAAVESILRRILRIPEHQILDGDESFFDLGMDSLMFMEFRNILQKMVGTKVLTLAALQENKTLNQVSHYILNLIYDGEENSVKSDESIQNNALFAAIKALKLVTNN